MHGWAVDIVIVSSGDHLAFYSFVCTYIRHHVQLSKATRWEEAQSTNVTK